MVYMEPTKHRSMVYICYGIMGDYPWYLIYTYIYIYMYNLELVAAQPTELPELHKVTSLPCSVRKWFFLQSLNAHGARDRPRSSYGCKPMPTHLLSSQSPRLRQMMDVMDGVHVGWIGEAHWEMAVISHTQQPKKIHNVPVANNQFHIS